MSFKIASSNNSLGLVRKFDSVNEFVIFYEKFITEQIDLINLPLKIGTQQLGRLLGGQVLLFLILLSLHFHEIKNLF